jgi:hypothetical protein
MHAGGGSSSSSSGGSSAMEAELAAAAHHQAAFEAVSTAVKTFGEGSFAEPVAAQKMAEAFQAQSGRGDPECAWAIAQFDYSPTQGDELALLPEDRVWVSLQCVDGNEGWHRGCVCDGEVGWRARGEEGVFPSAYVRMLKESEAMVQGLPLSGPPRGSTAAASGRAKVKRLVKKMVEVEVEVEESEGEEEVEADEGAPLPPGWVVKGLKKGSKGKAGRSKVMWYENVETGAITMKRPTK